MLADCSWLPMCLRPWLRSAAAFACLMLGSCAFDLGADVPELLMDQPTALDAVEARVMAARGQFERGDEAGAMTEVLAVLEQYPRQVDAQRLRQDLLRRRGRIGLLRAEAEERIVAWHDSADAHYLQGRIAATAEEQTRHFRSALERNPASFWAWLGMAFSQNRQNPHRALVLYRQLYAASDEHPLIALAYAGTLRRLRLFDAAMEVYDELATHEEYRGQADLGRSETLFLQEREDESWLALMAALRTRPFDAGVHRMLAAHMAHGLSPQRINQVIDVIWEDPERLGYMVAGGGAAILSGLMGQTGHLQGALAALAADGNTPSSAAMRRHRRRLLLASGDVNGFLRDLAVATPKFLLEDERNQIRGPWVHLLGITWQAERDQDDVAAYQGLIQSLVDVGLLFDADIVASMAMTRCRDDCGDIPGMQTDLRRALAFEGSVRRLIYRGYSNGKSPTLDQVIEEIRRLSLQILGEDVVGDPETFQVPLVGSLVNPFADGLGSYFSSLNKHLVLGQRYGGPVEGLLLTRLSVRKLERNKELPLSSPCLQVVGDNREIEVQNGVFGGDLAGIALLNHYVIDMDAVRDWADNLRAQREVMVADHRAVLGDPLPLECNPLDPVDAAWRLSLLAEKQGEEFLRPVFDIICWHERAHLVDSFYYLPPVANFMRVLGLMFAHGFDPVSIESEMEGRAETAALAFSPHTRLVLSHVASFLEATDESTHAIGFRRLAERINHNLAADPGLRENARVSRWYLVAPERLRAIARKVLHDHR